MEHHHLPTPPRARWPPVVAALVLACGLAVLAFALTRASGSEQPPPAAAASPAPVQPVQPAAAPAATTPVAGAAERKRVARAARRGRGAQNRSGRAAPGRSAFAVAPPAGWIESFYPIYAEAQRVFGVNWLLIASVHRQETAFSTAPSTYHGLNSAGCCGGPMQFNVTNGDARGRGSTWDRYRGSFRLGNRPQRYLSMRSRHPSLYDDFDSIMAAGALLRDNGAGAALDSSAWLAAYNYYGHDLTGVAYADAVTARAIGWARDGFCADCADRADLTARVAAAWGDAVRAQLAPPVAPQKKPAQQQR